MWFSDSYLPTSLCLLSKKEKNCRIELKSSLVSFWLNLIKFSGKFSVSKDALTAD